LNELLRQHSKEIQDILARYPADQRRSAIMPLLHLAQRARNYITKQTLAEVAEIADVTLTEAASIAGFYTLYHEEPGEHGRYRIQVCTDLPCALRGADEFLKKLCDNLGIRVGEITSDGVILVEEVTCLAGCHHAPLIQVQGDGEIVYHENQSEESVLTIVEDLRRRAAAKPQEDEA